jgi:hypothetical protein
MDDNPPGPLNRAGQGGSKLLLVRCSFDPSANDRRGWLRRSYRPLRRRYRQAPLFGAVSAPALNAREAIGTGQGRYFGRYFV